MPLPVRNEGLKRSNPLAAEDFGYLSKVSKVKRLDRFIPQNTSKEAYKASTYLHLFHIDNNKPLDDSPRTPGRLSSPEFFTNLNDTSYYEAIHTTANTSIDLEGEDLCSPTRQRKKHSKVTKNMSLHRKNLANSLELCSVSKVLMFKSPDHQLTRGVHKTLCKLTDDICLNPDPGDNATLNYRNTKRARSQVPYRILDAPSLRNDFYTNLISWSTWSSKVIVGLGCSAYIWCEKDGAIPILKHDYLSGRNDFITCVAFSPYSDDIIIGTKKGRILLFGHNECQRYYTSISNPTGLNPTFEIQREASKGIACVEWFKISKTMFIIGGESGEVNIATIDNEPGRMGEIHIQCSFQAHSQQICGLSIDEDDTILAIGGNDNSCTLWNIAEIEEPYLRFTLPHGAAVKAVAFCPWSKSLLATGGGSKDKTIRFWHSPTGTLINQLKTSNQITALIWSQSCRQLVATFGFGEIDNPVILGVYTYPELKLQTYVKTATPLRVLSAVNSPNHSSVCVAMNDETLRFYNIWENDSSVFHEYNNKGLYGSDIIEMMEGIRKNNRENIR